MRRVVKVEIDGEIVVVDLLRNPPEAGGSIGYGTSPYGTSPYGA
jgi:hypothetical protein